MPFCRPVTRNTCFTTTGQRRGPEFLGVAPRIITQAPQGAGPVLRCSTSPLIPGLRRVPARQLERLGAGQAGPTLQDRCPRHHRLLCVGEGIPLAGRVFWCHIHSREHIA